jgi:protein gp37
MADHSKIEWCDATFNPWVGCTKVSPACDHCYAENWAKRTGHPELWQGERRRTSVHNWAQPVKWDRRAKAERRRLKVFCASLADWLDNQVDEQWREDLAELIEETPNLDWLLLTKRPQNFEKRAPWHDDDVPPNVWLGVTAENQEEFDRRWPYIAAIQSRVHFISYEPALGPLLIERADPVPDWIICGGESGPRSRPLDPAWARIIRDQCETADIPFFLKQWGQYFPAELLRTGSDGEVWRRCADGKEYWSVEEFTLGLAAGAAPVQYQNVGKKAAGRLLDGREWSEFPA